MQYVFLTCTSFAEIHLIYSFTIKHAIMFTCIYIGFPYYSFILICKSLYTNTSTFIRLQELTFNSCLLLIVTKTHSGWQKSCYVFFTKLKKVLGRLGGFTFTRFYDNTHARDFCAPLAFATNRATCRAVPILLFGVIRSPLALSPG